MAAATEQRTLTITVPPDATGRTLLDYISSRFTYLDRTHWLAEIESGRLSLDCANAGGQKNGAPAPATTPAAAPAQPDAVLCTGALISWTGAPVEEPEVDENWSVLLETDDYLFINKPAGLPVHPTGRYRTHTLWNLLLERYGSLFFVNRLDRETSGVLLAAKNSAAAREAQTRMQSGLAEKEYLVLVEGIFAHELDAVGYLENDASSPVRKALRFVSSDGASAPERVIDAGS
ncbi:MAG TPA: pseudouridine synthase, partial [Treponemataceae bacterium]|nr:pseudouridine synthase [Treponemataceae bacterium]